MSSHGSSHSSTSTLSSTDDEAEGNSTSGHTFLCEGVARLDEALLDFDLPSERFVSLASQNISECSSEFSESDHDSISSVDLDVMMDSLHSPPSTPTISAVKEMSFVEPLNQDPVVIRLALAEDVPTIRKFIVELAAFEGEPSESVLLTHEG